MREYELTPEERQIFERLNAAVVQAKASLVDAENALRHALNFLVAQRGMQTGNLVDFKKLVGQ